MNVRFGSLADISERIGRPLYYRADVTDGLHQRPLSAISRHRLPRLASWEAHELERLAMTCLAAKQSSSTQSCLVLGS